MRKLKIAETIINLRPWPDLRCATTSRIVGEAGPARAGRVSLAARLGHDAMVLLSLEVYDGRLTHACTSPHSIP
jgi:hypothetical protein